MIIKDILIIIEKNKVKIFFPILFTKYLLRSLITEIFIIYVATAHLPLKMLFGMHSYAHLYEVHRLH